LQSVSAVDHTVALASSHGTGQVLCPVLQYVHQAACFMTIRIKTVSSAATVSSVATKQSAQLQPNSQLSCNKQSAQLKNVSLAID